MFDIGASEFLLTAIVAIVVIGPKDMPRALRTAGQWMGKMRRMSNHFRAGVEAMIREAELEEMEKQWREQNEAIMRAHPATPEAFALPTPASAEAAVARAPTPAANAETVAHSAPGEAESQPALPLSPP